MYRKKSYAFSCEQHLFTFRQFLFWTGWFFDKNRLLQMSPTLSKFTRHCNETSWVNNEQKDKIAYQKLLRHSPLYLVPAKSWHIFCSISFFLYFAVVLSFYFLFNLLFFSLFSLAFLLLLFSFYYLSESLFFRPFVSIF